MQIICCRCSFCKMNRNEGTNREFHPVGDEHVRTSSISSLDFQYRVRNETLGWFLIFNQETFEHEKLRLEKREGTNEDADNLENLAKNLGFQSEKFKNCTVQEIKDKMAKYAQKDQTCFACAILTHGKTEYNRHLLAAKDQYFHLEEVMKMVSHKECKTLQGKPKLFFIQACRTVDGQQAQTDLFLKSDLTPTPPNLKKLVKNLEFGEAHYLVAQSALPDCSAFRDPNHGSPFINALCECFQRLQGKGENYTINQVLCDVNRLMAEFAWNDDKQYLEKQMSSATSLLTRDLCFRNSNPALPLAPASTDSKVVKRFLIVVYEGYEARFGNPDTKTLEETAERLEFSQKIIKYNNKSTLFEEIKQYLQPEMNIDIFCCALLAISNEQSLKLSAEDEDFTLGEFLDQFTWNNIPTLKHKPKLFFMQTPKGRARDDGGMLLDGRLPYFKTYPDIPPVHADMLIAHSLSGNALKNVDGNRQSLFVSCLCENMLEFHKCQSIMQILQRVNRKMTVDETEVDEAVCVTTQLTQPAMLSVGYQTSQQ